VAGSGKSKQRGALAWLTSVIGVGTKGKGPRIRVAKVEDLIRVVKVARDGVFLAA